MLSWGIAAATALAVLASVRQAEDAAPDSPPPSRTIADLILPRPGAPLIVKSVQQDTTRRANGTVETGVVDAVAFRDAGGRVRVETEIQGPAGSNHHVRIFDRAAGWMVFLDPSAGIAYRISMPPVDLSAPVMLGIFGGPLVRLPGEKRTRSEDLGSRTILGIDFTGFRITTTIDGEPSVVGIQEYWHAADSGLIASIQSSGPVGLGNRTRIREEVRDAWRFGAIENWGRDLVRVVRRFAPAPLFVAAIVGTLTVGLGAFAVVYTHAQGRGMRRA